MNHKEEKRATEKTEKTEKTETEKTATPNRLVVADRGFFFGVGAFETLLMLEDPVLLKEHLQRLEGALLALGINRQIDREQVSRDIKALGVKHCAIKLTVTDENMLLTHRPLTYVPGDYQLGARLKVSQLTRDSKALTTRLKTLNYTDLLFENHQAKEEGYMDAVLLNEKGMVTETCFSNLFFYKEGRLHTPALSCGLLPGIVRQWIITHEKVNEGEFDLATVLDAEGIFITNSLMGLMPVTELDGRSYQMGEAFHTLRRRYQEMLNCYEVESGDDGLEG